jgi:nucleotide-binding universal stress UspA family protein
MSTHDEGFTVRRILVAVDSSATAPALLKTAALLAKGLDARLSGIFVEDINLLHLAGLPFARELTWSTAVELRIDYQRMERVLRGRGVHVRQAVVEVASEVELPLQVVRGRVAQELLRAAQDADLIVLGKGGAGRGGYIGTIARRLLREAQGSVLLEASASRDYKAVLTVFTGHDGDNRAFTAAARTAQALRKTLLVLIPTANNAENYRTLQDRCRKLLGRASLSVTYQPVTDRDAGFDPRRLEDQGIGLVVIHAAASDADSVETRVAGLTTSVLLVR